MPEGRTHSPCPSVDPALGPWASPLLACRAPAPAPDWPTAATAAAAAVLAFFPSTWMWLDTCLRVRSFLVRI